MPQQLRILTLGAFALYGPGGPIEVELPHAARSLLIRLARARGPVAREELAAQWWPDADQARARASLSTALWTLRSALRGAFERDALDTSRERIALDGSIEIVLDVERFESAIERGEDALAEKLYAGPYLRGVFEDHVIAERERLAALHEALLARLLHADADPERARRLVAADPYAEIAYRVLIDSSLAQGSRSAARAWMGRARSAFAELSVTPTFFLQSPYSGLEVGSQNGLQTNLAAEVTPFFGRQKELRLIDEALAESPVVTILGCGGSGKTRLAREVAARALGTRHSAVWFVELASFESKGSVASAIATTLGLREDERPADVIVTEALRDSGALLVLDNCEVLVEEVAELVARISRHAPLLRILTTSREALHIEAEAIVPIEGLALDDAVSLFLARARASDRRVPIDDHAAACALRIAEALDALPLAIELAAGRVRIDGFDRIANDALDVVRGAVGPRDRDRRTRTIGASIEWSVARLAPEAQTLFGRLGAFAGTFDADDAAALDLDRSNALDLLLDRSLVVRSDLLDVDLRLLAPVREDARTRLDADPKRDAVLEAHADCTRSRAIVWLERRGGEAGLVAERRLDGLGPDLEIALERLFTHARRDDAIDLVTALSSHWAVRGSRAAAGRWFARADAVVDDHNRRGDIAYARLRFSHDFADVDHMLRIGEEARASYELAANAGGSARALNVIGSALLGAGRIDEARAALTASFELQRELGDDFAVAVALANLGNVDVAVGDFRAALARYERCLPLLDRAATVQPRVKMQNNVAHVRFQLGDIEGSLRATDRALATAEASGNSGMIAFANANAALRAASLRDFASATTLARRVGTLADAPARFVGYALIARAIVAGAIGDEGAVRRFASAARAIEREHARFEPEESQLLAALPPTATDVIDFDLTWARALLDTENVDFAPSR